MIYLRFAIYDCAATGAAATFVQNGHNETRIWPPTKGKTRTRTAREQGLWLRDCIPLEFML
jgi:hypothetical protein